jgi:predicted membrane protein
MRTLRHLDSHSFAKLQSLVMAMAGVIAGLIYALSGFFMELLNNNLNSGTALAFLAIAGMPVLFATAGFLAGWLGAPLYNLLAARTGGIKVNFDLV